MGILPSSMGPNQTSIILEREQDHQLRRWYVDSNFSVPVGTPAMAASGINPLDPTQSRAIRAAQWWLDPILFSKEFVGFIKETFVAGECHTAWLAKEGIVRMLLDTPAKIETGDKFKFATTSLVHLGTSYTVVANNIVEPFDSDLDDADQAIFEAVESCYCVCDDINKCPPASAVPTNSTPMDVTENHPTSDTLREVRLAFKARW